jgi:hypothetical protein
MTASICAVQFKQKLMLHRNGDRILEATCILATTALTTQNLLTVIILCVWFCMEWLSLKKVLITWIVKATSDMCNQI